MSVASEGASHSVGDPAVAAEMTSGFAGALLDPEGALFIRGGQVAITSQLSGLRYVLAIPEPGESTLGIVAARIVRANGRDFSLDQRYSVLIWMRGDLVHVLPDHSG